MGWESSKDTMSEIKLEFSTKEQAVNYAQKNNEESNYMFTKALVAWQTGDVDNAQLHFETLVDEFAGTDNGKIAHSWLGLIAYNTGNSESSEDYLKKYIKFGKGGLLTPP
mgnify:CR=1 FL=1